MKRRDFLATTGAAAFAASIFPLRAANAADARPKKILYYSRSAGFEHSAVKRPAEGELSHSEKKLVEICKPLGIEVVCTKDGTVFDGDLSQYGAFAFYATGHLVGLNSKDGGKPISEAGLEKMFQAIKDGMGVIGFHAATDCSAGPGDPAKDPYVQMIGGKFCGHGAQQEATLKVVDPKFPGMDKVGDSLTRHEEWYAMNCFPDDLHVILVQETEGMKGDQYARPPFPSTWAHSYGKGRVFYTSLGHREDNIWDDAVCQAVMLGGVQWALGLADADIPKNIDKVTPEANKTKNG